MTRVGARLNAVFLQLLGSVSETNNPDTIHAVSDRPDEGDLPLFRPEVLEANSSRWMGRITLTQPISSWVLSLLAFLFAVTLVIFLCVGTYTHHESVQGQLIPSTGLLPITARSAGIATAVLVHEGQVVKKDQVLVELSGEINSLAGGQTQSAVIGDLEAQRDELGSLAENQRRMEAQQHEGLTSRIAVLNQQLIEIAQQVSIQQEQIEITEHRLQKLEPGVQKGTFSQTEFETYQVEALNGRVQLNVLSRQRLEIEGQLKTLQDQLQQLPLTTAAQENEIHFRLSGIKQLLAQSEAQRGVVLRAPRNGVVDNLTVHHGQSALAGQRLLSILPQGSLLQAELWLPSRAAGFLEVGNRVILRYPAFPYQKFGQQEGRVLEASRSATAASELATILGRTITEPLYRVLVQLDQQSVSAYGHPEPLKPGMTVDADILLDRRRLIEWVFEPLYGLNPRGH